MRNCVCEGRQTLSHVPLKVYEEAERRLKEMSVRGCAKIVYRDVESSVNARELQTASMCKIRRRGNRHRVDVSVKAEVGSC